MLVTHSGRVAICVPEPALGEAERHLDLLAAKRGGSAEKLLRVVTFSDAA